MSHSVETKEDNRTFKGGRNGKVCHICGEPGHFKKHCPQKQDKKHQKRRCNGKKNGKDNTEKIKGKLRKMIFKTNELKIKKENEIIILNEQTRKFQQLLDNSDNVDAKTLRNEIKNIAKSFKNGKKNTKIKNHKNKKCNYNKQERKQERKLAKEKKRLAKEERKRLKKEKKERSVPNTNISSEMNGLQHENEDEDEDTSSTDYEQVEGEGDNDNYDNAPDMNDHGDEFSFIFGRDGY